jgi:hypothetical protein
MIRSRSRASSKLGHRLVAGAILLVHLAFGATAGAANISEITQIHGFATQAFINTTDNNFFGETSADDHFGFTEIGVNASVRPTADFHVAGQVLSRRAGEGDDGEARLDYGLLDYTLESDSINRFGLRAGRILNPLGLYNETRDVAFTRPSIFLPQSIYFDRTRDLALSSDGLHAYGEHRFDNSELLWQLGVVRPRVNQDEIERALLAGDRPGSLESEVSYVGRLLWEMNGGSLRLAISGAQANIGYDPGTVDPFQDGSILFQPVIYSFQYNNESWSLTSEYARRRFTLKDFGVIPDTEIMGESGYLQGSFRLRPDWNLVLRYDVLYTNRDDRDGEQYQAATGGRAYSRYAKDSTVGLAWNVTPTVLLRAEFHRVHGTAWLPSLDNPDPAQTKEFWNMFSLLASYRF